MVFAQYEDAHLDETEKLRDGIHRSMHGFVGVANRKVSVSREWIKQSTGEIEQVFHCNGSLCRCVNRP